MGSRSFRRRQSDVRHGACVGGGAARDSVVGLGAARSIGGQEGQRMDRLSSERGFTVRCIAIVGMPARGGDGAAFGQTAGVEFVGVDETAGIK